MIQQFEPLSRLQESMLTELEILGNNAQVVGDEEESSLTVQIADMVIEYEFLLKSVLVAMKL